MPRTPLFSPLRLLARKTKSGECVAGAVDRRAFLATTASLPMTLAKRFNLPLTDVLGGAPAGSVFLDPYMGGSYSVWTVGQLTAFGGAKGRPEGSIPLRRRAHLARTEGFMEGCPSTGLRAVHEVPAAGQRQART